MAELMEHVPLSAVLGVPIGVSEVPVGRPLAHPAEQLPADPAEQQPADSSTVPILRQLSRRLRRSRNSRDGGEKEPVDLFFAAARSGSCEALRERIERGGGRLNINVRSHEWGMTALHYAAVGGHADAVELLLAAGADPMISDRGLYDDTPLHSAAYRGKIECVRALLLAGCPANFLNMNKRTPAQLAARPGGGSAACKEACVQLISDWSAAAPAQPVLVCEGLDAEAEVSGEAGARAGDVYYFAAERTETFSA
jgi:hypothetical protein